ncbi:MAG: hypothetical protein IKB98_10305 [Clostridia bacterium]|nr:hypothetical protein [Clostridia bacterium]
MKKIDVVDVTLKVASEQLNKDLSFRERLSISKSLEKMGVNAIELPSILNKKDQAVVSRTIAEDTTATITVACSDAKTIEQIFEPVKSAKKSRIAVTFPVSTTQMEYFYHAKAPKMLEKIAQVVAAAKEFAQVEFVAKDATRAEQGFVEACAKTAVENGASIITLCDDAGIFFPDEFASLVKKVKECCTAKVYVEPSNKLKMASAIAVEVIKAGADGIKTAVGADEYLSPDVLAEVMRAKGSDLDVQTDLDVSVIKTVVNEIIHVSDKDQTMSVNKADKASISAETSLKDISAKISALGYELSMEDVSKVFEEFQRVSSKKGAITDRELEAIVASTAMQVPSTYHLGTYFVNSGNVMTATANLILIKDGKELSGVSTGDGPIDAAFHAIEQIIGHHYELDDFNVQAVTKGREAVGSAVIRLRADGKLYSGNGVSTDIVGACIRAYINALNKIVYNA